MSVYLFPRDGFLAPAWPCSMVMNGVTAWSIRTPEVRCKWAPRAGIVHVAFPSRRGLLPSVRMLIDFLAAEYAALEASTPDRA